MKKLLNHPISKKFIFYVLHDTYIKVYIPLILLFSFISTISVITANYTFPNTSIGNLNVSLQTRAQVISQLQQQQKRILQIQVKNRSYLYTYPSLGVYLSSQAIAHVFEANTKPLPIRVYLAIESFFTLKHFPAPILFANNFDQQTQSTIYDFTPTEQEVMYDSQTVSFVPNTKKEQIRIDPVSLRDQIINSFGKKEIHLYPRIIQINANEKQPILNQINTKLGEVTAESVLVSDHSTSNLDAIVINSDDIKKVLGANFQAQSNSVSLSINDNALKEVLSSKDTRQHNLNLDSIKQALSSVFASRFQGIDSNIVLASETKKPNTDGTKAKKYIEVDLSQQVMYLWEHQKIVAEYAVSTGQMYPTPPGEYKILNKVKNAYSNIFHVWMPYWMAFYYAPDIKAYLGIHELPYAVDPNGDKMRRPEYFLGSPHTGGCISLNIGIAEKVFNWVDIGTPVYILQ